METANPSLAPASGVPTLAGNQVLLGDSSGSGAGVAGNAGQGILIAGNTLSSPPLGFQDITFCAGMSCSTVTTTLSVQMLSGSYSFTPVDASSFAVGQGYAIVGAGTDGAGTELIGTILDITYGVVTGDVAATSTAAAGSLVSHDDSVAYANALAAYKWLWYPAGFTANIGKGSYIHWTLDYQFHLSPATFSGSWFGYGRPQFTLKKRSASGNLITNKTTNGSFVSGLHFSGNATAGYLLEVQDNGGTPTSNFGSRDCYYSGNVNGLGIIGKVNEVKSENDMFGAMTGNCITINCPMPYGGHEFIKPKMWTYPFASSGGSLVGFKVYGSDYVTVDKPTFSGLNIGIDFSAGSQVASFRVNGIYADAVDDYVIRSTTSTLGKLVVDGLDCYGYGSNAKSIISIQQPTASGKVIFSGITDFTTAGSWHENGSIYINTSGFTLTGSDFKNIISATPNLVLGPYARHGTITGNTFNGMTVDNLADDVIFTGNLGSGTIDMGTSATLTYTGLNRGF